MTLSEDSIFSLAENTLLRSSIRVFLSFELYKCYAALLIAQVPQIKGYTTARVYIHVCVRTQTD